MSSLVKPVENGSNWNGDVNRHLRGGIGCVVPCDIMWLPRLLYCHVLVAKPFEVVSLQGNNGCVTKTGDVY